MTKPQIAILDFGSQYTHLIARRIRQLGVLADIFPPSTKANTLRSVRGLILSGGPQSVHDKTAIAYDRRLLSLGIPVLGLCYGHQLLAQHFGGQVKPGKVKEYGIARLRVKPTQLFSGLERSQQVWMSHGDQVIQLPSGFKVSASSADCSIAAMVDPDRKFFGLQFHPEVAHTTHGVSMLKHFVFTVCRSRPDWSMHRYWLQLQREMKRQVGNRNVFLLVSGGVDSTVAFAMLEKALGKKRVFGLHIDTGFMRMNESAEIKNSLSRAGFDDLVVVDASDDFFKAVAGLTDPEAKRKTIGATFLRVKDSEMRKRNFNPKKWMLGQGTIYPDTIESGGTKHADTIKTHHNRVAEILKLMKMGGLIEPLASLYKDEVREIGRELKLPGQLLNRHPFPGPGLAIRVLCGSGRERAPRSVQTRQALRRLAGNKIRANILPLKSVGVQGDNRTYRHPVVLQGNFTWPKLNTLSARITNGMPEVNRVVWLIAPKQVDAKQLRVRPATLTRHRTELLRAVDAVVGRVTRQHKQYNYIWQFPVILAPLSLHGGESIILRPIESREAMTVNFYHMPLKTLREIASQVMQISGIDLLLYDVTNKPPGTIEWE